jgi:hypothetical protein
MADNLEDESLLHFGLLKGAKRASASSYLTI